jgi:hypothetical protein
MKKEKQYNRKNLRDRLSCIMMIYLDGLGPKKKEKMKKYLDEKLSVIVNHYVILLKKKNLKMTIPPLWVEQIEKLCAEAGAAGDAKERANGNHTNEDAKELIQQS